MLNFLSVLGQGADSYLLALYRGQAPFSEPRFPCVQHDSKHPGLPTSRAAVGFLREGILAEGLRRETGPLGGRLQPDSQEGQTLGEGISVTGCLPFSFLQVLCTRCTETTSRKRHRMLGRSRIPAGPGGSESLFRQSLVRS